MRRIALLAISQCFGIIAFCQSPAPTSETPKIPVTNPASGAQMFVWNGGQFAQTFPSSKLPKPRPCDTPNTNQPQSPSRPDVNQLLQAPCMNPQIFALTAQNNLQTPPMPHTPWPLAKAIPIPTQWPNAKVEPIPTTWPDLKLLPLAERNLSPHPTK
jgi:hypothetical protein